MTAPLSRTAIADLARGVREGDRRSLARAITVVESSNDRDLPVKSELLDELLHTGRPTIRIGISGTPGVGKSTLIERLGMVLIANGKRVAVLAVDPTSARTGGSILGDKTRMPQLAVHPDAYVRPSAAGFGLGGITAATASAVQVCEAAGYDIVLVETVGVGQSETAVSEVTDLFLLLHSPGGGDELQGIKRGVMELADRVCVTKADGDLLPAATLAQAELRSALHLMRPKPGREMTPVGMCSAATGDGVEELIDGLLAQHHTLSASSELATLRRSQSQLQFRRALDAGLLRRSEGLTREATERARTELEHGRTSPVSAAWSVLNSLPQV